MNTLFSEIQRLLERTYASVGVNLEECLIDRRRCSQLSALAGAQAAELSMLARTFLRAADGRLRVGIYYSSWLIEQLERHDPRSGLSDANIKALIAFVEEINHALHAALQFQRGRRQTATRTTRAISNCRPRWTPILCCCFSSLFFAVPERSPARTAGGCGSTCLIRDTIAHFETRRFLPAMRKPLFLQSLTRVIESLAAARRVEEIRIFHALEYDGKRARIFALSDRTKRP